MRPMISAPRKMLCFSPSPPTPLRPAAQSSKNSPFSPSPSATRLQNATIPFPWARRWVHRVSCRWCSGCICKTTAFFCPVSPRRRRSARSSRYSFPTAAGPSPANSATWMSLPWFCSRLRRTAMPRRALQQVPAPLTA